MNISANTLLHFTHDREQLLDILRHGFHPRYCMENIDFSFDSRFRGLAPIEIAIPMMCFCDIRLSQIGKHTKRYGPYAVGLSLDWGVKNGLNPVMYEVPDSNPMKIVRDCLSTTLKYVMGESPADTEDGKKLHEIGNKLMFLIRYLKPYMGNEWDGEDFKGDAIKFYDEKEWRYVPDYYKMVAKSIKPFLSKDEYLDGQIKDRHNKKVMDEFTLDFAPQDIRYIILEKEEEVKQMIAHIEDINKPYPHEEKKLLLTKIISLDRLRDDF